MRIQLIQQKVPIGSQIILTLKNDEKVSGLLTEIGLDYITLDLANRQKIILADAILMFDLQGQDNEVEAYNSSDSDTESSDSDTESPDNEVEAYNSTDANTESSDSDTEQVDVPKSTDINTESPDSDTEQVDFPESTDINTESSDSDTEQVDVSESTDVNTESSDSDTEQVDVSESTDINTEQISTSESADANTESTDTANFEEQASEKLTEIVTQFNIEIEATSIELEPPNFTFPAKELTSWQNTDVAGKWLQIKNKYENAKKIDELSPKFSRVKPLLTELKSLVKRFPNSPSLKRVFAYFYALSKDWQEAIQIYQEVAITSDNPNDWFNVAVSALNLNKKELACYSLEKFFYNGSVIDAPNAWNIYVSLVEKFNNLSAFRELCKKDENDVVENEIEVLLDAAIYLFKRKVTTELAIEIVEKRIKGEPAESLLKEVCQKLGGQSAEPYRQFLTEFMDERIASEKKDNSMHLAYPEPLGNTKPSTHDVTLQKPYSRQKVELTGEELYREAQRADKTDKNLVKAEQLYRECIRQNIRHDSAIKDLAMVLVRLDRSMEAVELLEKKRLDVEDKQSLDNTLIMVYPTAGQYEKAIDLLNNSLKQTSEREKRVHIHLQISSNYIKLGNYSNAGEQFREVLKLRPNNITVQRNLALCLSKQEHYTEAEKILNRIQNISPNAKTAELLEAIEKAKKTGEFTLDDDSFIPGPSDFSDELSKFTLFFLERCMFEGLRADRVAKRVRDGKYIGSGRDVKTDIERLDNIAKELGPSSPRERSNYNLSAAKIYFDMKDNRESFYQYLCRSFASRGDAAVIENRDLDAVREWYCEALTVYDGAKGHGKDDDGSLVKDADGSLVRYLYSTLGMDRIPRPPKIPSINGAIAEVIRDHSDNEKVFDAIAYLVSHSGYAADRILGELYENPSLRTMALAYLKKRNIVLSHSVKLKSDFIQLWHEFRRNQFSKTRTISNDLRVLQTFELSAAWLEDNIRRAENIRASLFFELDKQRVAELGKILDTALELCKQKAFGEREHRCKLLDGYCDDLLSHITENPTKLSVKDIYPIIEVIQQEVKRHLEGLYETSKPQLTLRLAAGKESYVPVNRRIEVQIVLENEEGRMPADALKLVTQADGAFFEGTVPDVEQAESLRGGKEAQVILKVSLRLTDAALQSEAFSLHVYAEYGIRGGKRVQTPVHNLSIRLYSEDEFEKIENPYATYAEGGVVGDAEMFFGREELIQNIAQAIRESRTQSKSVMVFGQKRSGKSSVLYHLKKSLEKDQKLLILDLGNMSTLLDQHAQTSLLHQFLNGILRALERAIQRKQREGFSSLELAIPGKKFYDYPAPLQLFEDTFVRLKDLTDDQTSQEDWRGIRVVLLIDEFQDIYNPIIESKIPDSFMQNWKALLQANYFSAVLVGQDMMPKFKLRFPNEFGTAQDERVTYLKEEDARKLIDEPIRIGGIQGESRYREQAIERILDLTAGSPFYIQIICNRLVDYMNVKHAGLVTEADVEQVKNELIHGVNALGLDKFDNLINSGDTSPDAILDEDALKVLKAITDNSSIGPCHRDRIICETRLPVDTILVDLEKRDVVERHDQSYQIQVGLFKEWLVVNG